MGIDLGKKILGTVTKKQLIGHDMAFTVKDGLAGGINIHVLFNIPINQKKTKQRYNSSK